MQEEIANMREKPGEMWEDLYELTLNKIRRTRRIYTTKKSKYE